MNDKLYEILAQQIRDLRRDLEQLRNDRLHRSQFTENLILGAHIADGVEHVAAGNSSDIDSGPVLGGRIYYEEDTQKLKIWNSTSESYDESQFS